MRISGLKTKWPEVLTLHGKSLIFSSAFENPFRKFPTRTGKVKLSTTIIHFFNPIITGKHFDFRLSIFCPLFPNSSMLFTHLSRMGKIIIANMDLKYQSFFHRRLSIWFQENSVPDFRLHQKSHNRSYSLRLLSLRTYLLSNYWKAFPPCILFFKCLS